MKICIVSHEYPPFPGGGIATYGEAAAKAFARAGHEVHVITNRAAHGQSEPRLTARLWRDGNLTVHRLELFDEWMNLPYHARFFDINPAQYQGRGALWAFDPSNVAAHQIAAYVEMLHAEVGIDVIEVPEYLAEAFYVVRRRQAGRRGSFPPVCILGHTSTRELLEVSGHVLELGYYKHRYMMVREEYCIQHADGLQTPSLALMRKYEESFGAGLPASRAVIPYFLDVPEGVGQVPAELAGGFPFLLAVGRIEPRKGCTTALEAFALLADEMPELRLAFLGREAWRTGESFDTALAARVPERHRQRVLRLGNVPRESVLAAAQKADAFVHAAPWDNYPNAVLEAMAVGAACVVSDQGGQAEMVVDQQSGIVFPAEDSGALAGALRRVLADRALASTIRAGAKERVRAITDEGAILDAKIRLFESIRDRERTLRASPAQFETPSWLQAERAARPLPGAGLLVVDAIGATDEHVWTTLNAVAADIAVSPGWKALVLREPGRNVPARVEWEQRTLEGPSPWVGLPDSHLVVWLRAAARPDEGALHGLAELVQGPGAPCGGFLWLRPATGSVFPYRADLTASELVLVGALLPPVFCVRVEHLSRCKRLTGLTQPESRLCALMASAAAQGKMMLRHTGDIHGDFYAALPSVSDEVQNRATGYLTLHGLLTDGVTEFGRQEEGGSPVHQWAYIAELERIRTEHLALKQMKVVKMLRKWGVLSLARRMVPKVKKMIGPG